MEHARHGAAKVVGCAPEAFKAACMHGHAKRPLCGAGVALGLAEGPRPPPSKLPRPAAERAIAFEPPLPPNDESGGSPLPDGGFCLPLSPLDARNRRSGSNLGSNVGKKEGATTWGGSRAHAGGAKVGLGCSWSVCLAAQGLPEDGAVALGGASSFELSAAPGGPRGQGRSQMPDGLHCGAPLLDVVLERGSGSAEVARCCYSWCCELVPTSPQEQEEHTSHGVAGLGTGGATASGTEGRDGCAAADNRRNCLAPQGKPRPGAEPSQEGRLRWLMEPAPAHGATLKEGGGEHGPCRSSGSPGGRAEPSGLSVSEQWAAERPSLAPSGSSSRYWGAGSKRRPCSPESSASGGIVAPIAGESDDGGAKVPGTGAEGDPLWDTVQWLRWAAVPCSVGREGNEEDHVYLDIAHRIRRALRIVY